MAKIEEIVDGAKSSRPAKKTVKKAAKPTLSFPIGDKTVTEEVLPVKEVSAKKEITTSEPVLVDTAEKLEDLMDEVFSDLVDTVTTPKVVDQSISPVEETPSKPVSDYAAGFSSATKSSAVANYAKSSNTPSKRNDAVDYEAAATYKPATAKPFHKDQKPYDKKQNSKDIMPPAGMYPDHMVKIALIVKLNAEIRRFTALGILNYLLQKGEIKGAKRYVSFKWNKFTVKADNLVKEYSYTEMFFLNSLAASFASFSASAQRVIDDFTKKEFDANIGEVLSNDEINDIFEGNKGK